MKLQNNYTTPEQSQHLLELGLPADSADCHYTAIQSMIWIHNDCDPDFTNPLITPCWSVGRLLEICTICIYHYTGNNTFIFDRGSLRLGYIECLIAALEIAHDDGDIDFSKLED
jgi:hypothetical protein